MIVAYLFSSPEGDISLASEDLSRPFLITPEKAHPHLTLGNYFDIVKACILKDQGELLNRVLKGKYHEDFDLGDVRKIQIRSEKHGILYHLASVEVFMGETRVKFTLSTAISGKGVECMMHEHDILDWLKRNLGFSFLPEIYGIRKMTCLTAQGKTEEMVILAAQWFEDYHEWHMAMDPADGRKKIQIWDLKRGPRYASSTEASIIIEECARILTLYYDFGDFSHIGAWHHAAGDFIVKCHKDGRLDVRLTTVRQYEPQPATEDAGPMIAIIYFFLDTTVKMRLDRLDGVGETVWLGDFAVTATVRGFFEGLHTRETKGDGLMPVQVANLLSLLKSFDRPELERVFEPLMDHHATQNPDETAFMRTRISNHISVLCQALRDFH